MLYLFPISLCNRDRCRSLFIYIELNATKRNAIRVRFPIVYHRTIYCCDLSSSVDRKSDSCNKIKWTTKLHNGCSFYINRAADEKRLSHVGKRLKRGLFMLVSPGINEIIRCVLGVYAVFCNNFISCTSRAESNVIFAPNRVSLITRSVAVIAIITKLRNN